MLEPFSGQSRSPDRSRPPRTASASKAQRNTIPQQAFGFRFRDFGFRDLGNGRRVSGFRVSGVGFRVPGVKLRSLGVGSRVSGLSMVLNLRTTTSQKREAVPRRART